MAPALRVVAVVAELLVGLALAAVLRAALLPVVALVVLLLQFPAHKQLPLVLLQVEAVRPAPLPPEQQEVAGVVAVVLVQGLVASEILRSR